MDLPITTEIITIIILNNNILPQVTLHAVTAASKLGGEVTCLVAGPAGVQGVAKEAATVAGVSKVRMASLYCTRVSFYTGTGNEVPRLVTNLTDFFDPDKQFPDRFR